MTNKIAIDDCLTERDGHLFIEECDAVKIVEQYGSPIFVVSEDQLRRNVRRYRDAFAKWWTEGPVNVLPAVKANWTYATRRILNEEGAGADVYSEGELMAALKTGVDRELISVNGGGKEEAFLKKCVDEGVRITVEDIDEPAIIQKVAAELGKTAKIRFRVKPNFPNLWRKTDFGHEFASIDIGLQVYKAGIPAQYLPDLGREVLKMENVELVGLHFHGGRHSSSLWYWDGMMEKYAGLVCDLCEAWGGYKLKELDIGGGYASPRDPHNKLHLSFDTILTWLTWPLVLMMNGLPASVRYKFMAFIIENAMAKKASHKKAPTIEEYAETSVKALKRVFNKRGLDMNGVQLQMEPGRGMYGDTGVHLARVKKVKRQTAPIKHNWILTDTTYFFLSGGVLEYNLHDFRVANKTSAKAVQLADVVGQSCYEDRILPFVRVPELKAGDIIAFLDTGAYQEVSASNFNALPRPASVLVTGDRHEIIKRAETIDEIFKRDTIPAHLDY
jgi:diaminopimelate decarboxylase